MMRKEPKNSAKYYWTTHAKKKMRQYGLGAQRIARVVRNPMRTEESVAGDEVISVMQPQSTRRGKDGEKTWTNEIWVMYKIAKNKTNEKIDSAMDEKTIAFLSGLNKNEKQIRIISAWRYPGKTVPGESLPEEIQEEIAEVL